MPLQWVSVRPPRLHAQNPEGWLDNFTCTHTHAKKKKKNKRSLWQPSHEHMACRLLVFFSVCICIAAYTLPDETALVDDKRPSRDASRHESKGHKNEPKSSKATKEMVSPLQRWAQSCKAAQKELAGQAQRNMTRWCVENCGFEMPGGMPSNCPEALCACEGSAPVPRPSPVASPSSHVKAGPTCYARDSQKEVGDAWCATNCALNKDTSYCPERLCYCGEKIVSKPKQQPAIRYICNATEGFKEDVNGELASEEVNDAWCMENCNLEAPNCPETHCKCKTLDGRCLAGKDEWGLCKGTPKVETEGGVPGIITGKNSKDAFDAWTHNEQKKAWNEGETERKELAHQAEEALKEHEEGLEEGLEAAEKRRRDQDEQRRKSEQDAAERRALASGATQERDKEVQDREAAAAR